MATGWRKVGVAIGTVVAMVVTVATTGGAAMAAAGPTTGASVPAALGADSSGTQAVGVQYSSQTVVIPASTVAAALKSVSPDGSIFTFSSAAGALAKLKAGSVMLLQGTAVRVVTSVSRQSGDLVVSTTPASITDLITNGTLSWDTPVNFADAFAVEGAGVPSDSVVSLAEPGRGALAGSSAGFSSVASRFGLVSLGGGGVTIKGKTESYDYSVGFKQSGSTMTMTITFSKDSPVELTGTVTGTLGNLTTAGAITVQKGHLGSAKVQMNNLQGKFTLSYELKPLTAFGLGSSGGIKITLPAELTVPFVIGGVPFFLGVKTAFFVSVGFSNKNQSIEGSYTVNYDGNAGFSTSTSGATTALGAIQGIGQVVLDQANAILNGPITLVLGAQVPELDLGLGVKGLSIAGYVDLIADTAVQVGGGSGGLGASTGGCDARELEVEATAGAKASFFGFSVGTSPVTLFSKIINAAYPPGCGTVGG